MGAEDRTSQGAATSTFGLYLATTGTRARHARRLAMLCIALYHIWPCCALHYTIFGYDWDSGQACWQTVVPRWHQLLTLRLLAFSSVSVVNCPELPVGQACRYEDRHEG